MFFRRGFAFIGPQFVTRVRSFCSKASTKMILRTDNEKLVPETIANCSSKNHFSPLFPDSKPRSVAYDVELVDDDTWTVSCGLAGAWEGRDKARAGYERKPFLEEEGDDDPVDYSNSEFDDIDDMRIQGHLFFKLDRSSKEFEEYSFDFHRKQKEKEDHPHKGKGKTNDKVENRSINGLVKLPEHVKRNFILVERENNGFEKKLRTPTFNQLTDPYHIPFCLDIFISKASVRACVVHRVTSKVVAVAHSISKDMKFDLTSRKGHSACAAVGSILAQRALADDIHNLVYTPRKGEKIEGKLQTVLKSVMDSGIDVKVKIKQRKRPRNPGTPNLIDR